MRTLVLLPWLVLIPPSGAAAQDPTSSLGLRYAVPYEALADTHRRGYGVTWTSWASSGTTWSSLGAGWTRFQGKAPATDGDTAPPELDQAELLIGLGVTVANLTIGARGGYFFRDRDEWALLPTLGARFGRLMVTGEAKVLGKVRWYGGSISWLPNR